MTTDKPAIEQATRHAMLTARCRIQDRRGQMKCIKHDDYVTDGMCETVLDIVSAGFTAIIGEPATDTTVHIGTPGYGAPLEAWLTSRKES